MSIGFIFSIPRMTQEQYDQIRQEVQPDNKLVSGMLSHVGGPSSDSGAWRVVEIWESQDAATRFFDEKLGAALKRANVEVQPEIFQVYNSMGS